MLMFKKLCTFLFLVTAVVEARADAAFLLEEPYGHFGAINPTGHAAVYLSGVCADSPTRLRRCSAGEAGVVLSRYHRIAGRDWVAIPLVPYLYAVERPKQIPAAVDVQKVSELRDAYRRRHLRQLAPDNPDGSTPDGDWYQLVGSAYDRTLWGFQIETTPEQDDRLIEWFNSEDNRTQYHLLTNNCADLTRQIMNFYAPHSVRRNLLADMGVTTPKQVARSLVQYARKHPELELSVYRIPQVPGSVERSHPTRGIAESLVKTKKYVIPLFVISPFFTGGLAVAYLTEGRFNPRHGAGEFDLPQAVRGSSGHSGGSEPISSFGGAAHTGHANDALPLP
jgi:hypothetical protein